MVKNDKANFAGAFGGKVLAVLMMAIFGVGASGAANVENRFAGAATPLVFGKIAPELVGTWQYRAGGGETDFTGKSRYRSHRNRDPAFADADRYKERSRQDKRRRAGTHPHRFTPKDFDYDQANRTCRCPAGHNLYRNGNNIDVNGYLGVKFRGAKSVCRPCTLRHRCLTTPETTDTKQVTVSLRCLKAS